MIYAHIGNNKMEIRHTEFPFSKLNKFEEVTLANMKAALRTVNKTYCERDPFQISNIKQDHFKQINFSFSQNNKFELEKWNISEN